MTMTWEICYSTCTRMRNVRGKRVGGLVTLYVVPIRCRIRHIGSVSHRSAEWVVRVYQCLRNIIYTHERPIVSPDVTHVPVHAKNDAARASKDIGTLYKIYQI